MARGPHDCSSNIKDDRPPKPQLEPEYPDFQPPRTNVRPAMSFSSPAPELKNLCIEYLAESRFHESFILPPSKISNRKQPTRVTYCDAGCRIRADGSINKAVILFCGGMFAGRWLGTMFDVAALKCGIRLLSVDRPGLGGTPEIALEHRVQTWLEIVPALLEHLGLKHVALVSHSAGTIYLLNTLLHLRHVLHPTLPYVAMLAPWVHHADSSSKMMSLTNIAPLSSISNFHNLTGFVLTSIMPSVGPMFTFSGNIAARIGSSLPSSATAQSSDVATMVMRPGTATVEMANLEKEILSSLRVKYALAEGVAGGSQEALLCLKRPENNWGFWENYDALVPLLVNNEKLFVENQGRSLNAIRRPLRIDAIFAQNDKLTNGKKGAAWFDNCWKSDICRNTIDYRSETVLGQSHESVIDPDLIEGPMEKIFMLVAKQSKSYG